MKCQGFIKLRKSVLEKLLHYNRNTFMDFPTLFLKKSIVNDFLSKGVLEHIFQVRLNGSGSDQIQSLQSA